MLLYILGLNVTYAAEKEKSISSLKTLYKKRGAWSYLRLKKKDNFFKTNLQ